MELTQLFGVGMLVGALVAVVSFFFGIRVESRLWREKGDHEYMNTKESVGRLYTVKRVR